MLSDYQRYRLYEIMPGLSVWLVIIGSVLLSFVKPLWMMYGIIVFDVYWVLRVLNYCFYILVASARFHRAKRVNWRARLDAECPAAKEMQHVVFLTVFNEEWSVVRTAIGSVAAAAYDPSRFVIVIAGEAREAGNYSRILSAARHEFGRSFADIVGTLHPADLPDEIPGKGSNLNYSELQMLSYINERGWDYDKIIVTVFDIDTVCHPEYFSYLTYLYCTHPRPTRSSYQPVALYNNNMWDSPAMLRVMAFGTTFWLMTMLARQDGLVTFSSHSMSWRALADAGFHDKKIVSEDSRIFYQCLLRYAGDYEVTPMYIPVSMDTVRDDSWWKSMKNLYRQQRRWAWGAEHVPYLLWQFRKPEQAMPWWKRVKWLIVEWEGKWSWCLVAILLTVIWRLPALVAPAAVREQALFFNAPYLLGDIMSVALVGLLLSAVLSFPLLPKRPESHPRHRYAIMLLQWLLVPFSLVFVSAIPAIDALTHLMFGKYLGFNISQKKRSEEIALR